VGAPTGGDEGAVNSGRPVRPSDVSPTESPTRAAVTPNLERVDIALGLDTIEGVPALDNFAHSLGAYRDHTWRGIGLHDAPPNRFDIAFEQSLNTCISRGGRIKFNLDSINIDQALSGDPNIRVGRYTEWELQQIVRSQSWFEATDFYLNGQQLTASELLEFGITLVH
jgi:hypothetical protein